MVKNDRLYYVDKKNGSLTSHSFPRKNIACVSSMLTSVKCTTHECLLIQECHSNPTGGHLGRSKTAGKMKTRYYWPNLYVDMNNLVS